MPCSDGLHDNYYYRRGLEDIERASRVDNLEHEVKILKSSYDIDVHMLETKLENVRKRNDMFARMLCGVMTKLKVNHKEVYESLVSQDEELRLWWEEHEEEDFDRCFIHYRKIYPKITMLELKTKLDNGELPKV